MKSNLKYNVDSFFDLFIKELENAPYLHKYYNFHTKDKYFNFRKAYFIQRLQYISDKVKPGDKIWDCGCGYGTTALFFTLNGYKVFGSTLEFYYNHIPGRLEYWKQFSDISKLKINYENVFDNKLSLNSFDTIIVQDTLHHLEPLEDALKILSNVLKKGGQIIAIEENGSNIIQNLKLYKQRGNKRTITVYDEKLKKDILLGNENIRPFTKWKKAFSTHGLTVLDDSLEYIRVLPPQMYGNQSINEIIKKEQSIRKKSSILRKYFFFGINFVATKQ